LLTATGLAGLLGILDNCRNLKELTLCGTSPVKRHDIWYRGPSLLDRTCDSPASFDHTVLQLPPTISRNIRVLKIKNATVDGKAFWNSLMTSKLEILHLEEVGIVDQAFYNPFYTRRDPNDSEWVVVFQLCLQYCLNLSEIRLISLDHHFSPKSGEMPADPTSWKLSVDLFDRVVQRCETQGKSSDGSHVDIYGQYNVQCCYF